MNMKRIAIIGAGPTGLCTAKSAVEEGLSPIIYEKSDKPGGIWRPGHFTWNSMRINSSKFTTAFIDHAWPKGTPIQPLSSQVYDYILSYIEKYSLSKYIKYNSSIERLRKTNNSKWELTVRNYKNEREKIIYDYVIVANGLNNRPNIPEIENKDIFEGKIMHSCDYKENLFKGKKIIVVGCSASATQLAVELTDYENTVLSIFLKPYIIFPNLIRLSVANERDHESRYKILPYDFVGFSRQFFYSINDKKTDWERKKAILDKLKPFGIEQLDKSKCPSPLYIDLQNDYIRIAISDDYYDYIKNSKIKAKKCEIVKFEKNGVLLSDGSHEECDVVLFGTSYLLGLEFLSKEILDIIKYDEMLYEQPIVLYEDTFHPELDNLAFVGLSRGYFFLGAELQAKWVCKVFSGKKYLPSKFEMSQQIADLAQMRSQIGNLQFPPDQYVKFVDKMAEKIDLQPNFELLKLHDPFKYDLFYNKSLFPFHYDTNGLNKVILTEVELIYSETYTLEEADEIINKKRTKKLL